MQYGVMQYSTVSYSVVQCSAVRCNAVYSTVYSKEKLQCTVRYSALQCGTL